MVPRSQRIELKEFHMRYVSMITAALLITVVGACENRQTGNVVQEKPKDIQSTVDPSPVTFHPALSGLPEEGMWKCDPVFRDVNNDGKLDLAALPRLGNGPRIWLGDGQGNWTEQATGLMYEQTSCGGGLDFADFNGDGHIDLVVADHCQGLFVYLGDGNNNWEMVEAGLFPHHLAPKGNEYATMYRGLEDAATGDLNNDGFIDVVAGASDKGGISVYFGNGTGRDWVIADTNLPTKGWANRVHIDDINNDGKADLVASYSEGPRAWLQIDGKDWKPVSRGLPSPTVNGLFTGLDVGDVNEDGLADIAIANWVDGPEVYLQQSDGSWEKSDDVFPDILGGAVGLDLGDADGDGHLDMVVSGRLQVEGGYVRGVFLLRGDGHGNWKYYSNSGLPTTGLAAVAGVTFGDFNNDGKDDVCVGSGLIVETVPGPKTPAIPVRLPAWRAE